MIDMDLIEELRAVAPAVFDDEPVLFAYLYGSRANGVPRADSDIDIAVYFSEDTDPSTRFDERLRLPQLLVDATGRPDIEVASLNDAPLRLAGRVVQGVLVYSRDEPARVAYESLTFRRFCDFDLHDREDARAMLRATAEGRY